MFEILARRSHFERRFKRKSWSCLMPPYLAPATLPKKSGHARQHGQTDILVLYAIGRPKMDFRRLCFIPSALWAEEWGSCVV